MNSKKIMEENITVLMSWLLTEFEIDVVFESIKEGGNAYYHDSKLISINNRTNMHMQLHTLLHECGHVVIRENKPFYNLYFPKNNKKIDILREEVYAWDQAWNIAESFDIFLVKQKFMKHRDKSLMDYIKWVSRNKKKKVK